MSYDLCFWKEQPGPRQNAAAVYEALLEGRPVPGLLPFPVEDYLKEIEKAFPEAVREHAATEQVARRRDGEQSMFEVTWSSWHALITLRPGETHTGNRLVEIAASLGAPLYDPQTGERFDSWIDG